MDFTREPIVETIITPKDGFRLVIRSSKNPGQEEFLVDALEVISFGSICFYRHLERPRAFIVPASEYEVLEVRESRMPLKAPSFEGTVKLSTSREFPKGQQSKEVKETSFKEREFVPKENTLPAGDDGLVEKGQEDEPEEVIQPQSENKIEKRKDRKRGSRRRRGGRDDVEENKSSEKTENSQQQPETERELDSEPEEVKGSRPIREASSSTLMTTILPPPETLIRDDLDRLRKSDRYKGAFYLREESSSVKDAQLEEDDDAPVVPTMLQEEDDIPGKPEEENVYKATPAPLEEEEMKGSLLDWRG